MLALVLLVLAFACLVLASFGVGAGRLNLIAAGLALWLFTVELLPRF